MNLSPLFHKFRHSRGYATLAGVAAVSLALISMLTFSLIANMHSFDTQAKAQMKQDYSQKEDAILTALLHIVPNKAIGAMKRHSALSPETYTWETIFEEALTVANAEQSADSTLLTSLDLSDAIIANTGDTTFETVDELVLSPSPPYNGERKLVNGGNWYEYRMLFQSNLYPFIPAPVMLSYNDYQLDQEYPIVSNEKRYVYNYQAYDQIYHKGLKVSSDAYPLYNQLEYPDVRFGYRRPGEKFVAKRNWWTFSLTFGKKDQEKTGLPPVKKTYVLSLYEIPSQVPLSATALMKVGKFEDGTDWENVTLDGSIYADKVETEGTVAMNKGSIAARKSLQLSSSTSINGKILDEDFDEVGKREARALQSDSDFYEASLAGNVGKVAFIPLNPGENFLTPGGDGDRSERISPTGWNYYTRGATRCAMRVEVSEMISEEVQVPVEIKFRYIDTDGNNQTRTYRRGLSWPTELQPGGDSFPFQTTVLENMRNALVLRMDRFPDFLASIDDAAGVDVNHSVLVRPQHWKETVSLPNVPSLDTDLCVTLRGGKDMTSYQKGFSVVTNMRLYIGETINSVQAPVPANSGLPSDAEYYPPISLFAPEKRFGESTIIENPIALRGQLNSLKNGNSDTFNPLELKTANDSRIASDLLDADLVSIESPAELPPVFMMNWMLTIEEVHR